LIFSCCLDMTSSTEDLLAQLQAASDKKTPVKNAKEESITPEGKPL